MSLIKKKIFNHLKNLGIKKGDNLLVYSKLSSFGIINNQLPEIIIECLTKKIGKNGSLVMPLYTFGKKKELFDIKKIYPNSMIGLLNKKFFERKSILRSKCPIHSHIGIGPNSKCLNMSNPHYSFGKKSDFYYFHKKNFKMILLGCTPQEGATYFHHLEAIVSVSYRKWVVLKRKVIDYKKNKIKFLKVNFFSTKKNIKYDLNKAFNGIVRLGAKLKEDNLKYGNSYSMSLKDLHKYGLILLKKNKNALIIK